MSVELNIPDIIKQLIAVDDVDLNDLREEDIQNLTPINNVSTGLSPSQDPEFSFYVGKETPKGAKSSFEDMMTVIISEELYPLYIELDEVPFKTKFNQIIYSYISKKLEEARESNVSDTDNIWMQPNTAFINWFHENSIDIKEVEEKLANDEESDYRDQGLSEIQISSFRLYSLTKIYIKENPKQTDGTIMSIRKAAIIVYNENKTKFPKWTDGSIHRHYYFGQNIHVTY